MKTNLFVARAALVAVAFTFCGVPQLVQAQSSQPATPATQQATPGNQGTDPAQPGAQSGTAPQDAAAGAQTNEQQPSTSQDNNGMVDPSKGPLTPVPSNSEELPNAPSAAQTPAAGSTPAQQQAPLQAPAGAAAAQTGPTSGGAASKPAGNAIAPAKQRQVRSLLIKLGAVAAAGVAIGTVVALSKGSPSTPPGAK